MLIETPHRVVIVGCGFAGLFATYALRRAPVTVTIIDRTNHHLFQPLLYQVATGILSEGDIAPPIREVVSGQYKAIAAAQFSEHRTARGESGVDRCPQHGSSVI